MVPRYENEKIKKIWNNENKLRLWQEVELAVIGARCRMEKFPSGIIDVISKALYAAPIDIEWWKARDKDINHDLNAFIDERVRHLDDRLHQYFHIGLTSYDTEEPAMSLMLLESILVVENMCNDLLTLIHELACKYRYTPMIGRTHGQEAKLQSFGKRCLTWEKRLWVSFDQLIRAKGLVKYSKLSGAIGNYQGLTPEEEEQALKRLSLEPYIGATQIMPREIHQPLATALLMIVGSLTQIANDIALAARSGLPTMQEPFGRKQKGSSAMPHKKNTITCENQRGMFELAKGYVSMIHSLIVTWEERSIEQSSAERNAWPDLFHAVCQSFKNMNKILSGLTVYPDNMMIEIIKSHGCYASEDAKDWLKEKFAALGLKHEDAYRAVQLASFLAHEVAGGRARWRYKPPLTFEQANLCMLEMEVCLGREQKENKGRNIKDIILNNQLIAVPQLEATSEEINAWNKALNTIFSVVKNKNDWEQLFEIDYQLRGEKNLFPVSE